MSNLRFLMCPPDHFGVEYVINPWMAGQVHAASRELAITQWASLRENIAALAEVLAMPAQPKLPDLVFTANAALIWRDIAVLSSFRCPERRGEEAHYSEWLHSQGFNVRRLPEGAWFEGAGDALFDRGSTPLLWAGHGFRSHFNSLEYVAREIGVEVQPLGLRDPRFYHLDTCFCPLEGGYLLYFPQAIDAAGNAAIEQRIPADQRFAVTEDEAKLFACNAVNIGNKIIANAFSPEADAWLHARGFEIIVCHTSEFMKAGGSAKCLSLRLNEN